MIELLRRRRTIRTYANTPIPEETIVTLKEAALRSPTSRNRMAWKFWFVQDSELLHQLSHSKNSGSAPVGKAPLAIVIGADESQTDVWIEDCSIAAILLQLTAQSCNLGSCWIQIRNRQCAEGDSESYVKKVLGITAPTLRIEALISLGYPAEERPPVSFEDLPTRALFDK